MNNYLDKKKTKDVRKSNLEKNLWPCIRLNDQLVEKI